MDETKSGEPIFYVHHVREKLNGPIRMTLAWASAGASAFALGVAYVAPGERSPSRRLGRAIAVGRCRQTLVEYQGQFLRKRSMGRPACILSTEVLDCLRGVQPERLMTVLAVLLVGTARYNWRGWWLLMDLPLSVPLM